MEPVRDRRRLGRKEVASVSRNCSLLDEKEVETMYLYELTFKSEGTHTVVYDKKGNKVCDAESVDEAIRDMKEDGLI